MVPVCSDCGRCTTHAWKISLAEGNSELRKSLRIFRVTATRDAPTFNEERELSDRTALHRRRNLSTTLDGSPPRRITCRELSANCSSSGLPEARVQWPTIRSVTERRVVMDEHFLCDSPTSSPLTRGCLRAALWLLPSRPTAKRGLRAWIDGQAFYLGSWSAISVPVIRFASPFLFTRADISLSLSLFAPLWRKVRKRRVAGIVKCTERANACTSPIPHDVRIAPVFISHATNVNAKRLLTSCRNNS